MLFDGVVARVLDDAFTNPERQIEPAMRGVTLLKVLDDAECVDVVVESPPMALEAAVQCALTRVPKGRVADVVNQRKRLRKIFVKAKRGGDGPGDLRYLNRVGEATAKMIRRTAGKYLRLARKASEGTGLHNALAVPLKRRTRGTGGRRVVAGQKEIVRVPCDRASMERD